MSKPKFKHDCDRCKFLGHVYGCDMYSCPAELGTVLVRYGNDGPEYSSCILSVMKNVMKGNISVAGQSMTYAEFIESEYASNANRAMVYAIALM